MACGTRDNLEPEGENGDVFVSMDVVTMIASAATILVALFGGFAWFLHRMDAGFVAQEARMDARFDRVDDRFDRVDDRFDRVDDRFDRVGDRFDRVEERLGRVEQELTEVKIAIARLEGPRPRLVTAR